MIPKLAYLDSSPGIGSVLAYAPYISWCARMQNMIGVGFIVRRRPDCSASIVYSPLSQCRFPVVSNGPGHAFCIPTNCLTLGLLYLHFLIQLLAARDIDFARNASAGN